MAFAAASSNDAGGTNTVCAAAQDSSVSTIVRVPWEIPWEYTTHNCEIHSRNPRHNTIMMMARHPKSVKANALGAASNGNVCVLRSTLMKA